MGAKRTSRGLALLRWARLLNKLSRWHAERGRKLQKRNHSWISAPALEIGDVLLGKPGELGILLLC